jgi:hypothetical protein
MPISKITGASIDTAGSGITPAGLSTGGPSWDTGGNVGIGTSSQNSRLHIRQDQDGVTRTIIQNRNSSGTPVSEVAFITGAFDFSDSRYAYIQSGGGSSQYLAFGTGNGTTPFERARIDSGGRVTMPYQPHYVGDERSSTLNTGGEATFVDWVHSITRINTGSHMNTSTGVFTCPVAGRYFVQFNVLARATGAHNIEIRKNNSLWVRSRDIVGTSGNEECNSLSTVVDCAVNDNIRISVSNGASADFYNQWNSTTIYLVG